MDEKKTDLSEVLDEELHNCIEKLRNATYGYEVRTFITEYEELMLKKSKVITEAFIKKENLKVDSRCDLYQENKSEKTHNALRWCICIQGIAVIVLAIAVILIKQ